MKLEPERYKAEAAVRAMRDLSKRAEADGIAEMTLEEINAEISAARNEAQHAFVGDIIPLLNEQVLKEYMEVLKRPKFHFNKEKINIIIDGIIKRGIFVDAEDTGVTLPDPKDAVFYEIVMEKRKHDEAFLVTGNIKHFPTEPYIVTPREMLTILEND